MSGYRASIPGVLSIRGEVVGCHVLRDPVPEQKTLNQGVVVVKTCVDPCTFYLSFQFMNVLEVVGSVRDRTADGEVHPWCPKVLFQRIGERSSKACMRGGILGMPGRDAQGSPCRVGNC